jgi:cysteine desulfurase
VESQGQKPSGFEDFQKMNPKAVKTPIYMDCHSTTPVDPRVLEAMLPAFREDFGNAASRSHVFGWRADAAVEKAREQIADLLGASSKEIVFTSGATESDNLALKGVAEFYQEKGNHLITVKTEHKAVLDTAERLARSGFQVTELGVDSEGLIDLDELRAAITPKTLLVSVMFANNEIGVIQPLKEIGAICREKEVLFHTDAVQGVGKLPFNVAELNVDLASITAHKMYGPKGIGALYVSRRSRKDRFGPRLRIRAQMDGGGHERGMRSGTLNVPLIVGFGKAAELCKVEMAGEGPRIAKLRDRLQERIVKALDFTTVNGSQAHRLPGSLNISFAYVEGEAMMMAIKDVAVSSGSACTSASLEPSYVLRAMGVEVELAHSSIRFGLGRFNTEEEVDYVADLVIDKVKRLRDMSPLYEMAREGIDLKSIHWGEAH